MKIFITGASGFIGGAVTRKLALDHFVLGMARSDAAAKKVTALGARAIPCSLDTIEPNHLKHVDVVIHCAAFVEPWGTWKEYLHGNVEGTKKMIEAAKEAGVKRFIHVSTESVLFHGQDMVDINESYPYPPKSPFYYSESKKQAEILALDANEPGKFEVIVIRPRLVWGPGDTTILPNLLEMVDSGRFRWISGGHALTSSSHIDNVVEGIFCALTKGKGGQTYFITDWEVHTFKDFLTMLLRSEGREPSEKSLPGWMVRLVARVFEGIYRLFRIRAKPPVTRFSAAIMSANFTVASDKAERELGYKPVISVENGMKAMTTPQA